MRRNILNECLRIAKQKNRSGIHPLYNISNCHFSFVIQFNSIVEMGMNRRTEPLRYYCKNKNAKGRHSEVDAYRKAKGILDHDNLFEIINIRLNKRDETRISKPCSFCHDFLKAVGCRMVYYSTNDGFKRLRL